MIATMMKHIAAFGSPLGWKGRPPLEPASGRPEWARDIAEPYLRLLELEDPWLRAELLGELSRYLDRRPGPRPETPDDELAMRLLMDLAVVRLQRRLEDGAPSTDPALPAPSWRSDARERIRIAVDPAKRTVPGPAGLHRPAPALQATPAELLGQMPQQSFEFFSVRLALRSILGRFGWRKLALGPG